MPGIIDMLLSTRASVSAGVPVRDPALAEWFGGGAPTASGQVVNERSATALPVVLACVRILAESVAQLPMMVYKAQADGGQLEAPDHPLYVLLHEAPNGWMTDFEWRELVMRHLCLWGNHYSRIVSDGRGVATSLEPMEPAWTRKERRSNGAIVYHSIDDQGRPVTYLQDEVLHIKGLGNGFVGLSPIQEMREAIGLGLAQQRFGARFFGGDGRPIGVLQTDQELGEVAVKNLRESWAKLHGGGGGGGKIAVLEQGMKWQPISVPNNDAQFLESRTFQLNEIARAFRVPPHMIAELTRSTNNNIEQQSLEFVMYTLLPWVRRIEKVINRDLFGPLNRGRGGSYFVAMNLDALLRADMKSRFEAYAVGRQWGFLTANDINRLEKRNPLPPEIGDVYLAPLNMVNAATYGTVTDPVPLGGDPAASGADPAMQRAQLLSGRAKAARQAAALAGRRNIARAHRRLFLAVAARLSKSEANGIEGARRKGADDPDAAERAWREAHAAERGDVARRELEPILWAYAEVVADAAAAEVGSTLRDHAGLSVAVRAVGDFVSRSRTDAIATGGVTDEAWVDAVMAVADAGAAEHAYRDAGVETEERDGRVLAA